jgi:hypothetical protein
VTGFLFRLARISPRGTIFAVTPSDVAGTVMRMQNAYLLICLSIWCHFDDVMLAWFPNSQSAPLIDEDGEYLSVKPDQRPKKSSPRQKSGFVGLKPNTGNFLLSTRRDARPALKLTWPVGPSLVYVFMSLQR